MIKREVGFFLIAGGTGFMIDAGGVYVFSHLFDVHPVIARVPSFLTAIMVTFFINRTLTFAHARHAPIGKAFMKYISANGLSQGVNFVVYTSLVTFMSFFHHFPVFAVAAGSAIAAVISFLMFKYIVFKPHGQTS